MRLAFVSNGEGMVRDGWGCGEGVDDKLVAALWLIVGPWRCVGGTGRVADRQCLRALVTRARL